MRAGKRRRFLSYIYSCSSRALVSCIAECNVKVSFNRKFSGNIYSCSSHALVSCIAECNVQISFNREFFGNFSASGAGYV